MKALLLMVAAAGTLLISAQASANDELAKANGCLVCHTVDKKVLGPAYKDIAAKYKGDKTAEAKLIEKIKNGSSGVWGPIPMPKPAKPYKDEDVKTLVQWILSL